MHELCVCVCARYGVKICTHLRCAIITQSTNRFRWPLRAETVAVCSGINNRSLIPSIPRTPGGCCWNGEFDCRHGTGRRSCVLANGYQRQPLSSALQAKKKKTGGYFRKSKRWKAPIELRKVCISLLDLFFWDCCQSFFWSLNLVVIVEHVFGLFGRVWMNSKDFAKWVDSHEQVCVI